MSEDLTMEIGKHALSSGGSVGLFAIFSRWMDSKRAEETNTRLALMEQKLDQLVTASTKHESTGERVALLEQSVKAITDRLDALVAEPPKRRR